MSLKSLAIALSTIGGIAVLSAQQTAPQPPATPSQSEVGISLSKDVGVPLHYAVPDFLALTADAETAAAAKLMAEVLSNDLAYEREFDLIPRDTYRTIPAASSPTDIPFDRWRELGADGVVIGTVQKAGTTFHVEMHLFDVKNRAASLGKVYDG